MTLLRTLALRLVGKLRREPVAVWGVVVAAVLGLLSAAGVPAAIVEGITAALTLGGIPVVRGKVTPLAALQALFAGMKPAPTLTVTTESGTVHDVTVHIDGQPLAPLAPRALGRHVEHDERSKAYAAERLAPVKSVRWERRSPVFDQGNLGSCTGNAAAGWLATDTGARKGRSDVTEATATAVYSKATHLDRVRGFWPPNDTGSSGLAAAKALVKLGLAAGPYRHAFGLEHALSALQGGPVLVGMEWLTGCDSPDHDGLVTYAGSVRGGHEILADEVDAERRLVGFTNSWGTGWGKAGRFYLSWDDFAKALAARGDVTVPS